MVYQGQARHKEGQSCCCPRSVCISVASQVFTPRVHYPNKCKSHQEHVPCGHRLRTQLQQAKVCSPPSKFKVRIHVSIKEGVCILYRKKKDNDQTLSRLHQKFWRQFINTVSQQFIIKDLLLGSKHTFLNIITKEIIGDTQYRTRNNILYAKSIWHSSISISLCPCAQLNTNQAKSTLPDKNDGMSPIKTFSQFDVTPRIKNYHTFGCVSYKLTNCLHAVGWQPEWELRNRLGINLGSSPRNAASTVLILSMQTGLVSPQFHIQFDELFETVWPFNGNPPTPLQWQRLSGIKSNPTNATHP